MARLSFPEGFVWGSATSAHQVEGQCVGNHWWAWEQEGLRTRAGGFIADGSVSVDGREIYTAEDLRVGLFTSTEDF